MYAIEINELTKDFPLSERGKYLRAVDHLSLRVDENSVYGLLGPNGSGKSTTIRMLLGLSKPSSGQCMVFEGSPQSRATRTRVGYLPDAPYYYKFLSGEELLRFYGKCLGLKRSTRQERADRLLRQFGLGDAASRKVGAYSKGMLQRLGFAQALMGDPDLLVLDEPTAGVDPVGAAAVGDFVMDLKQQGKTVLLCSHLLSQVQGLCDRIGIMNKGRLLAEGPLSQLLLQNRSDCVRIENLDTQTLEQIESVVSKSSATLKPASGSLEELFRSLVESDNQSGGKSV